MNFDSLAHADTTTLLLILLIAAVAIAFPGWLALYRDIIRARAAKDERADKEVSDTQTAADARQQRAFDAVVVTAGAVKDALDLFARMQDAREAEIGVSKQNSTYLKEHGETLLVITQNQDDTKQTLKQIQGQAPTLQETHDMVKDLQDQVDKFPDVIQAKLKPFFDKIDANFLSFKDEIDADFITLKTEVVKAIAEIATQTVAPVPPVNITNTVTTTPPVDVPVTPPNGGASA